MPELRRELLPGDAVRRFGACLTEQAEKLPELTHNQDAILEAGTTLITDYSLLPSIFDDEARSLIFTSLAKRQAAAEVATDPAVEREEKNFVFDVLTLLAYAHSPALDAHRLEIEKEEAPQRQAQTQAIYDRYTHGPLSRELQAGIDAGLLDGVKARLGITPENEDPYEVRVLSIDPEGGRTAVGLNPPHLDLVPDFRRYKQDLRERAEQMKVELGWTNTVQAWVRTPPGSDKRMLCIPMPLAEKLLYPELTAHNRHYDEAAAQEDLVVLEHEYTHTQGESSVDGLHYIAINLEEKRAKHYSRDGSSYPDVEEFFDDLALVTGLDVTHLFERAPKGGRIAQVHRDIAAHLGLDGMLEVLVASPYNYLLGNGSNEFQCAAFDHVGGYDGVTQRLIAQEMAKDGGSAFDARLEAAAVRMEAEQTYRADWMERRARLGLEVITDMIIRKRGQIRVRDLRS